MVIKEDNLFRVSDKKKSPLKDSQEALNIMIYPLNQGPCTILIMYFM